MALWEGVCLSVRKEQRHTNPELTVVSLCPVAARVADSHMGFTPGRLGDTKPGGQSDWTRLGKVL